MEWYIKVMTNYFNFEGRARRKEYWMFLLINVLISVGLGFVIGLIKAPPQISALYSIAIFIPSVAVAVRRMHDTNHSGWWILFPLYNLALLMFNGEPTANRFGPAPKTGEASGQAH
jgi:uncharacterized membrane protein YhaH (DUF805 family)